MGLFGGSKFRVNARTVLLTGGSQGMGLEVAKLLAKRGAHIIIVARNQNHLSTALEQIKACARDGEQQSFHAIAADVALQSENKRMLEEATIINGGRVPEIVWANAGASHPSLFLETDMDIMRQQMEVNYWSAAYLAQYTLRAWLAADEEAKTGSSATAALPRHFIMTSSVAVFLGVAGYGPYAPAKAALRALADTLHSEVNIYNGASANSGAGVIKIHLVVPGTMLTPGYDRENESKHATTFMIEEDDIKQTALQAAQASITGLDNGDFLIATQFIGSVLRAGGLGGSQRNGLLGLRDTLLIWITSIGWLFAKPDTDRKLFKWGKQNAAQLSK